MLKSQFIVSFIFNLFLQFFIWSFHIYFRGFKSFINMKDLKENMFLFNSNIVNHINYNNYSEYEPILKLFYKFISFFTGPLNLTSIFFLNLFIIIILLNFLFFYLKLRYLEIFFLLIFLDPLLITQFFRQTVASIFIILYLYKFYKLNIYWKFIYYILISLFHNSSLFIIPIALFSLTINLSMFKYFLFFSFILYFLISPTILNSILNSFFNIPILNKLYFFKFSIERGSNQNFRLISIISLYLIIFIKKYFVNKMLLNLAIFFLIFGLLLNIVPILGLRIGFIGNGILTGIIYLNFILGILYHFNFYNESNISHNNQLQ
jgi:hypothetical protein